MLHFYFVYSASRVGELKRMSYLPKAGIILTPFLVLNMLGAQMIDESLDVRELLRTVIPSDKNEKNP